MMDGEDDVKYPPTGNSYVEDDNNDDDDDDDEDIVIEEYDEVDDDDDDDDDECGVQRIAIDDYADDDDDDDDYDYGDSSRHPKKKKLKSLLSSYEFAPRVPRPSSAPPPSGTITKPSNGKRNPLTDWTEKESFILLDAWGDRFLKQGRKSLRSEEWQEVAEKVSQESKIERTDTQCRNRLDTLKKKYKKEKSKFGDDVEGSASEWVYFKKMDMLLSSPPQKSGLSCGVDSGEFVFMNPKVYLNSSNGLDEMRDSPGNSEDESEQVLPSKKKRVKGNANSFKLLADAISKFSSTYEKVEKSKRQKMLELEKVRMDFYRDLELQKRQIVERARDEIVKIRQGDYGDNENDSG
ncbi:hypothetical protein ACJIZ3_025497 [Penstemon smallii]|uniref:Myb-like domain-containing protein n=1 Tax=Penstemon smallii TaxID=265156 RepID=A0ABD3TUT0_9LAMI